ncbi:hypothetical protein [Streptomyces sp. NPDC056244]|uniref:hypothetical protein n=1 Tax=Streptomyces sp. NPDC056244 TaxID=3345762 RepID=UPI0035DEEF63
MSDGAGNTGIGQWPVDLGEVDLDENASEARVLRDLPRSTRSPARTAHARPFERAPPTTAPGAA